MVRRPDCLAGTGLSLPCYLVLTRCSHSTISLFPVAENFRPTLCFRGHYSLQRPFSRLKIKNFPVFSLLTGKIQESPPSPRLPAQPDTYTIPLFYIYFTYQIGFAKVCFSGLLRHVANITQKMSKIGNEKPPPIQSLEEQKRIANMLPEIRDFKSFCVEIVKLSNWLSFELEGGEDFGLGR